MVAVITMKATFIMLKIAFHDNNKILFYDTVT